MKLKISNEHELLKFVESQIWSYTCTERERLSCAQMKKWVTGPILVQPRFNLV